jgi:outer membrane protein TolC
MKNKILLVFLLLCARSVVADGKVSQYQGLTLDDCIRIALEKHQSLQVSRAALEMAEAQYHQAMSAYWPQLDIHIGASRADQDRTFSLQGSVSLPGELANIGPKPIKSIPLDMNLKLMDRDILSASVNLSYPIFTGGKRHAIVNQAKHGIDIAKQGVRKSTLSIIRDIKRFYYGAEFARRMEQLTSDTLERFQVIEELTELLFQNGSLRVKKTDYLRTKTTTAVTRAMLHEAHYATELAYQALANSMGLEWTEELSLRFNTEPFRLNQDLQALIDDAENFNPDIQQLHLAIMASEEKITEARSGYYPRLSLGIAGHKIWSDFESGVINSDNQEGWTIGLELKWNLFDGFKTSAKVDQAKAEIRKLESQKILLNQATALLIKQHLLRLKSANQQIDDFSVAVKYAAQNRDLHIRAYREEMVKTQDVLESQVTEAFVQSSLYRARYNLNKALYSLEFQIGQNIQAKH